MVAQINRAIDVTTRYHAQQEREAAAAAAAAAAREASEGPTRRLIRGSERARLAKERLRLREEADIAERVGEQARQYATHPGSRWERCLLVFVFFSSIDVDRVVFVNARGARSEKLLDSPPDTLNCPIQLSRIGKFAWRQTRCKPSMCWDNDFAYLLKKH